MKRLKDSGTPGRINHNNTQEEIEGKERNGSQVEETILEKARCEEKRGSSEITQKIAF